MRNLIVSFLFAAITSVVFLGCSQRIEEVRINNVVRVFWHENTRYSVQVREPGSVEIKTIRISPQYMCSENQLRLLADVPPEKSMWIRYVINQNWDSDCLKLLEIHIHSEKDIEGGGWNHGKFGRGQTSVIK